MTTIYDIAKKCNVSPATVSRALKDDERISVATKNKVKNMAKELNYYPNGIAKSLKMGRSHTIGVIVNDIATFAVPRIIDGIEEVANNKGYNLILCNSSNQPAKEKLYFNILKEKQVEGIIFVGTWAELDNHCNYLDINIPFVAINRHYDTNQVCTINHDDVFVSYLATNYLFNKGYQKIAFINGPQEEVSPPDRLKGFKKAMSKHSLVIREEWLKEGDWYFDSGYALAQELLIGPNSPEAIVAGNDYMAIGAIKAIEKAGLEVPGDIAVIGCDNRSITRNYYPRVTTVELPLLAMGQTAAYNIFGKILNGKKMKSQILKSSIVERNST